MNDGGKGKTFWHAGLLLLLACGAIIAWGAVMASGRASDLPILGRVLQAVRQLPSAIFPVIPIIAGIAVGISRVERGLLQAAIFITVLATLLMATTDLAFPSTPPSLDRPIIRGGSVVEMRGSPILTVTKLLLDSNPQVGEVLSTYPVGHPRPAAVRGLFSFLLLLMPTSLVGIMLGTSVWISDRVSFRQVRDERIAKLFLAWGIAPGCFAGVVFFSLRTQAAVLFRGESPFLVLLPAIPLLTAAAFGWRAILNAERRLVSGEASREARE